VPALPWNPNPNGVPSLKSVAVERVVDAARFDYRPFLYQNARSQLYYSSCPDAKPATRIAEATIDLFVIISPACPSVPYVQPPICGKARWNVTIVDEPLTACRAEDSARNHARRALGVAG